MTSLSQEITNLIRNDLKNKCGDRRQEITFIGVLADVKAVTDLFSGCLLKDAETKTWEKSMERKI